MNKELERRFSVRSRGEDQGRVANRSYLNDDYNKHAGPNYREASYQEDFDDRFIPDDDYPASPISGQNRARFADPYTEGQEHYDRSRYLRPGVSGKDDEDRTWINDEQLRRQHRFVGKGPKGYRRSDERIREEVCEALAANPFVDPSNVEVRVKDGVVTLSGTVEDRRERRKLESIIENMPGVVDIDNGTTVA